MKIDAVVIRIMTTGNRVTVFRGGGHKHYRWVSDAVVDMLGKIKGIKTHFQYADDAFVVHLSRQ